MIFGSVINENLKDEIVVTVIATGFDGQQNEQAQSQRSTINQQRQAPSQGSTTRKEAASSQQQEQQKPSAKPQQPTEEEMDTLDIPTFLRNRRNR
jgi:cell division protein FtsZ